MWCLVVCSVIWMLDGESAPAFVVVETSVDSGFVGSDLGAYIPNNLTLAVTTLVLNQGRYLREWVEVHRLMGFQFFLIFDDGSTDNSFDVMAPYVREGMAVVIHARRSFFSCMDSVRGVDVHQQSGCQRAVFSYARAQLAGKASWMGNFDVDEFVWTPAKALALPDLLTHSYYALCDRLDLVGVVFGTSNVSEPTDRPVLETFTRRARVTPAMTLFHGPRFAHKALYRPEKMSFVGVHGAWCVTCSSLTIYPLSPVVRLNHYQYKSRSEQRDKAMLNRNPHLNVTSETESVMNEVEDREIIQAVEARGHSSVVDP